MSLQKRVQITYQAVFSPSKSTKIAVWLASPQNSKLQQVHDFQVSPKTCARYQDNENSILYLSVDIEKPKTLKFSLDATIRQDANNPSNIQDNVLHVPEEFLREEPFLEHMPWTKNIVHNLIKKIESPVERVRAIFNFILNTFKYRYPVPKRGVATMQPERLIGDCGEYSSLFVTMCRIASVPARNETGFVLFPETGNIVEHGWASVHLKSCGWVDVDTQWAQIEKDEGRDPAAYFLRRPDYRIVFTRGFNIRLIPPIPDKWYAEWYTEYWKSQCLPVTKDSVQTLQPLVFAAENEIEFNAEIFFN